MVAVALAHSCNEIDVDVLHKCRDEQIKIVASKQVSEVPSATVAETIIDETVPEEPAETPIWKPVDVVVSAL